MITEELAMLNQFNSNLGLENILTSIPTTVTGIRVNSNKIDAAVAIKLQIQIQMREILFKNISNKLN